MRQRILVAGAVFSIWGRFRPVQQQVNTQILGFIDMLADGNFQFCQRGLELFRVGSQRHANADFANFLIGWQELLPGTHPNAQFRYQSC